MIKYSTRKILKIPINLFYETILSVSKYKHFVPWCKDSWEINKITKNVSYDYIVKEYPMLLKSETAVNIVRSLANKNNNYNTHKKSSKKNNNNTETIPITILDGSITVGFNIIEFSYTSHVVSIHPNIVLSITDSSSSNVFKKLEGLWVLKENEINSNENENKNKNENENKNEKDNYNENNQELAVEYDINFEFKSKMFSNMTNMFLNFLGENIIKAFIKQCQNTINTSNTSNTINTINSSISHKNKTITPDNITDKLNKIKFDSQREYKSISTLIHKLKDRNIIEVLVIESILDVISYNNQMLKKMVFLSENAVWSNEVHVRKLEEDICRCLH